MDAKRGLAGSLGALMLFVSCDSERPADPEPGPDTEVASVEISPAPVTVAVGETQQLEATLKNAAGTVLTGKTVAWSSTAPAVADVTQAGLVSGVSAGTATVRAQSEGEAGEVVVTVTADGGGGPFGLALTLSSYLGGSAYEHLRDVAVDGAGNAYLVGGTESPEFPVTAGAFQTVHNPGTPEPGTNPMDVFVTKVDASGGIVWSTFLGGRSVDRAYAVEVDGAGYVYVAGRAGAGFPVTSGAFQTEFRGGEEVAFYGEQDGFVCKIRPDGGAVEWCSYFGGTDPRIVRDVAVDGSGDVYLASGWSGGSYPSGVASRFVNSPAGGKEAVVAKVRGDGSVLEWARYVGGSGDEENENSVRLDGAGGVVLLATTRSADLPVTAGAYDRSYNGAGDLLVGKFAAGSGAVVWLSYLGGSENEETETHELAVGPGGEVVVVGPTRSADFPTTAGAYRRTLGGVRDAFVAKLSADGARLEASTYVGGGDSDWAEGVAVDGAGRVYFTGKTASGDFPVTADAVQRQRGGRRDAVAVVLTGDLSAVLYATLLGGGGHDSGRAAAVGADGAFWFGGETLSSDWPTSNALQSAYGGGNADAIVARLAPSN